MSVYHQARNAAVLPILSPVEFFDPENAGLIMGAATTRAPLAATIGH